MRRVVVTGLGMIAPTGNDVHDAWKAALKGESAVRKITAFDPTEHSVQIAAEVKDFDIGDLLDAKEARRASRFVQFAVAAAHEAITDAGFDYSKDDQFRYGCAIGAGLGSLEDIEKNTMILQQQGPRKISPFFIVYTIPNMASGVVSRNYKLKGPNMCTTTACASGTHAIGEAFLYITQGMADLMVAGGTESAISPLGIASFAAMKALSTNNECPEEASRPFDLHRDGFVMGEGSGVIVMEELEHAKKRGAKIYAEMVGYGLSGDAYHVTAPAPDGQGAKRCIQGALEMGKIPLTEVDYINAHGTSTKLNDALESQAIAQIFGPHASKISISSTKGVTGHLLGGAGGVEAAYTILSIYHSLIPPTANLRTPDPECPLDYTPIKPRERKIKYALSNSFGFGGTNAAIAFKSF